MRYAMIAQTGRLDRLWDNFSASFRGDRPTDSGMAPLLAAGAAALVLLVGGALAVRWFWGARNPASGPWPLFRAALRSCGVPPIERILLSRVAKHARLPHPAAMLLTGDLYEQRVSDWLGGVSNAAIKRWASRRLSRARRLLYGDVQPRA